MEDNSEIVETNGASSKKKRTRKSTVEWSDQSTIDLILSVEKYEHLWNKTSAQYKNREMTENAWQSISNENGIQKDENVFRWNSSKVRTPAMNKNPSASLLFFSDSILHIQIKIEKKIEDLYQIIDIFNLDLFQ